MNEKKIRVIVITIGVLVQKFQLMKGVKSRGGAKKQLIYAYFCISLFENSQLTTGASIS